jgi:hypothetical protein
MTTEDLKVWLENPLICFALMVLGTFTSIFKQVRDAYYTHGTQIGYIEYLFKFWPETMTMLMTNTVAFIALITTGTLNAPAAWGVGYAANSISDLIRRSDNSRSANLQKNDEEK